MLNKLNWSIYNFNKNKGLDGKSFKLLQSHLNEDNFIIKYDYSDALLLKETDDITSVTCISEFSDIKEYIEFLNKIKGPLAVLIDCNVINYINIEENSFFIIKQFLMYISYM